MPVAGIAVNESTRTLQFAMQVKGIRNRPLIQLDPREKLIQDLRLEIERLREENARLKESSWQALVGGKTGEYLDESTLDEYSPSPSPGSERESEGGSGGWHSASRTVPLPRVAEKIGVPSARPVVCCLGTVVRSFDGRFSTCG